LASVDASKEAADLFASDTPSADCFAVESCLASVDASKEAAVLIASDTPSADCFAVEPRLASVDASKEAADLFASETLSADRFAVESRLASVDASKEAADLFASETLSADRFAVESCLASVDASKEAADLFASDSPNKDCFAAKPCTDAARCGSETPDRCASDLCVDEADTDRSTDVGPESNEAGADLTETGSCGASCAASSLGPTPTKDLACPQGDANMEVVRAKRRARKKKQSEKAASSAAAAFAAQAGQSQGLSLENLVPVPAGGPVRSTSDPWLPKYERWRRKVTREHVAAFQLAVAGQCTTDEPCTWYPTCLCHPPPLPWDAEEGDSEFFPIN